MKTFSKLVFCIAIMPYLLGQGGQLLAQERPAPAQPGAVENSIAMEAFSVTPESLPSYGLTFTTDKGALRLKLFGNYAILVHNGKLLSGPMWYAGQSGDFNRYAIVGQAAFVYVKKTAIGSFVQVDLQVNGQRTFYDWGLIVPHN